MSQETKDQHGEPPHGLSTAPCSLAATVNRMWRDAYGDQCSDVTDEKALCLRVEKLAEDRKCWVFNARQNQKENNRLESLLLANSEVSHEVRHERSG